MITLLLLIIVGIAAAFLGVVGGIWGGRLKTLLAERKLIKNAMEIIEGKRKNEMIDHNGKKIEITRFVVRGDDGTQIVINLTGKTKEMGKDEDKDNKIDKEETKEKPNAKKKKTLRNLFRK